ncbi:DUF5701 family protein [Enteractinococcus coprophilus]|uniref:Uncharacterized protein n=1 Tax=Enteractinococcus coprophilus TaxID=1027633 RepID=A0A543A0H0_9MICC|nr:DUF5701 family protein [Enteractinococcus coprophilus]TQL66084.1 hypothetical protein FB556_2563 [Enteractinococcus coprophilus]
MHLQASTPTIESQLTRLIQLGVPALAGYTEQEFTAAGDALPNRDGGIIVVHPHLLPPSRLAPLLERDGKSGFVVVDMVDLDKFEPLAGLTIPVAPLYVISDINRGDDMLNWSPDEALAEITTRGRRPLTISEGISWLLQQPDQLEPNRCFMTIASRKRKKQGLDARTPAIWISSGTGRDGKNNRGAPKVGWCWARNRHTWLGFASTL